VIACPYPRLAADGFPAVVKAQPQSVALSSHDAVDVAEAAHQITITVEDLNELAVVVVAILYQCLDCRVGGNLFNLSPAAEGKPRNVVVLIASKGSTILFDIGII
jgi:hypothetical protein